MEALVSNQSDLRGLVIKGMKGYHPVGILCNWLLIVFFFACVAIAVFKGKVLSALLIFFVVFLIRKVIMYMLTLYLVRKYVKER
ncbi:hypothetical protein BKM20_02345 [Pseudomonas avellanae]|uniref:Uncharacterized protein n=2 Tax=Pseudomonas avellanae TaxID=46257 RepID=A0AAD0M709_9PSED|nr:hypothetical protein BKM03_15830 [Pseudomonas avellanae]KWS66688.1 hypothetical protein AL055_20525 [Pseudomonas amygdali pv. morsprunorum]PHN47949.1 hypothetical protein AO261_26520 [Pseudomonas avellanae]POC97584.1 hypothetical protein BKM26_01960 [Pseudomonas avellanae]POD11880.1 hypothetical protein BKM20_02345 [Pseudomonas avellanae]